MQGASAGPPQRAYLAAAVAALALLALAFSLIGGASLTYDEATYAELAADPPGSSYYPGDVFLLHPPLAYAALWAWQAIAGDAEVALRSLSLLWSAGGIALTALALRARGAPPALALVPAASLPLAVPLLSVTMYPAMFFFLALAAWGHATDRRGWALAGWNLALLTHEIVLLLVAAALLPAAWRALRTERPWWRVPLQWLRISTPYPAAWAWGLLLVARTFVRTDPRAGNVAGSLAEPLAWDILKLLPLHTLALALAATPALLIAGRRMLRGFRHEPDWGAAAFGLLIVILSPFYRYLLAPLPTAIGAVRDSDVARLAGVSGLVLVLVSGAASTGVALAMMLTGHDPVNDADVPGLVDHDAGATLLEPGDVAGARSPPALAYYLQRDGWTVVDTGAKGPSGLRLERDGEVVTLVAVVTPGQVERAQNVTALLVPGNWPNAIEALTQAGWTAADQAGNLHRFEPPAGAAVGT